MSRNTWSYKAIGIYEKAGFYMTDEKNLVLQMRWRCLTQSEGANTVAVEILRYCTEYKEAIAEIIRSNLLGVNLRDYTENEMREVLLKYSPEKIQQIAAENTVFVATENGAPAGCVCVSKGEPGRYALRMMFVDPARHGMGIGRGLLHKAEAVVRSLGGGRMALEASRTAHAFYRRMGYEYAVSAHANKNGVIPMYKDIESDF